MYLRKFAPALALGLVACGGLPALPDPLPSDFIPSPTATEVPALQGLTPDGFTAAQSMTVRVRNAECGLRATGTGFALDDHTLVTNASVVANSRTLELATFDGETIDVTASQSTTIANLAILQIDESLGAQARLAVDDPAQGDAITVVGYPGGGRLTTTAGVVLSETDDPLGGVRSMIGTSAQVEDGESGSPVVNGDGEVVGVIYATDETGQSFMIPVSALNDLLGQPRLLIPESTTC